MVAMKNEALITTFCIINSGYKLHICRDWSMFSIYQSIEGGKIMTCNGQICNVVGVGEI